ncbi:MAG: GGDEF domain-containing protein [Candidatus Moranbacteria bacterium]|nr:GGDEF domain-containing protein [Candidatus Moranbacteria bacterium]
MKKLASAKKTFWSDGFYKKILDSFPAEVITVDREGFLTFANKNSLVFSDIGCLGKGNIFESDFFKREKLLDDYRRLLDGGLVLRKDNCLERDENGRKKYLKFVAVPLENKFGGIKGALFIVYDNTEVILLRKRLEKINKNFKSEIEKRTIQLERANRELEYIGLHDGLTGLHNRNFFMQKLKEFKGIKKFEGCVLMFDVDNLKSINDELGHIAGDRIICKAAKFISGEFKREAVIARIGGDEFCVLLPKTKLAEVEKIVRRLRLKIFDNQNFQNRKIPRLGLSIGISYVSDGKNLNQALTKADKKMYENKSIEKKR